MRPRGTVTLLPGVVPPTLGIKCDFGFKETIKTLPQRKWNKEKRQWEARLIRLNAFPILGWVESGTLTANKETIEALNKTGTREKEEKRDWPQGYKFKTEPLKKQFEAIKHCYAINTWNLPAEMGCGKTKIALDVAAAHIQAGRVSGLVVISRVNLRENWIREYKKHCPVELNTYVLESTRASVKKIGYLRPPFIVSVGVESLQQLYKGQVFEALKTVVEKNNCMMVIDESHFIKGHKSNRSKNVEALGAYCKVKGIMTGTPVPKNILDLYQPLNFLSPDILGYPSFFAFRLAHTIMGGYAGKQVLGFRNVDHIMDKINPYTFRMYRSDVVDLPPLIRRVIPLKMSPTLRKAYVQMKKERTLELEDKEIVTRADMLSVYMKLRALSSGYVSDSDSAVHWVEPPEKTPKALELKDTLDSTDEKAIIWVNTHAEIHAVEKTIGDQVVSFHGHKTIAEREQALEDFKVDRFKHIVATVASMQTGLTLTEATLEIFYSLPLSYSDVIQAEARAYRIGQDKKVLVLLFVTEDTVDAGILSALIDKKDVHDFVMDKAPGEMFAEVTVPVDRPLDF